jgi:hypothetical protein
MSSGYRILADENIERATRTYLVELGTVRGHSEEF